MKIKKALVFQGGGAKIFWVLGFVKWLWEIGELAKVRLLCGTSAGGLLAIALARYWGDFQKVLDMFLKIKKNTDIYYGKVDIWGFFKIFFTQKTCKSLLRQAGLFKITKEHFGGYKLKDFPIDVCVTGTNLTEHKAEIYYPHLTKEYDAEIMANITSGIPLIMQCTTVNGKVKGDGGVMNNTPVLSAIKLGATDITVLELNPIIKKYKSIKNRIIDIAPALLETLLGGYETDMWDDIARDHPHVKIKRYAPKEKLGGMLDFTRIKKDIDAGYEFAKLNYIK